MNLPVVHTAKCLCGHEACQKHGLDFGTFYQGTGWSQPEAEEIAKRINAYPKLITILQHAITREAEDD